MVLCKFCMLYYTSDMSYLFPHNNNILLGKFPHIFHCMHISYHFSIISNNLRYYNILYKLNYILSMYKLISHYNMFLDITKRILFYSLLKNNYQSIIHNIILFNMIYNIKTGIFSIFLNSHLQLFH